MRDRDKKKTTTDTETYYVVTGVPELEGVEFKSSEEAAKAEREYLDRNAATEAISKYGRAAASFDNPIKSTDIAMQEMPGQAGFGDPSRLGSLARQTKDIQSAAEGEVLREMYPDKNSMALSMDVGASDDSRAKNLMGSLEKQSQQKHEAETARKKAEQYAEAARMKAERDSQEGQLDRDAAQKRAETIASAGITRANISASKPQTANDGKPLSTEGSKLLGQLAMGVSGAQTFLNEMSTGDANFWATTTFGQFSNPKANLAVEKMTESLGRMQSGGAITSDEEKRFKRLMANPKLMATAEGRSAIMNELREYIDRSKTQGSLVYGGDGWIDKFKLTEFSKPTADNDFGTLWGE
jgi:hypothetical protein